MTRRTPITARELNELPAVLTPAEVAKALGLHVSTVRDRLRDGTFPIAPITVGNVRLIPTARLAEMIGLHYEAQPPDAA